MDAKRIGVIFPTYWTITDDVYKQYGGLEPRTAHVAKLLANDGHEVRVFAPRGSQLTHKNIKVYSGNFRAWDGRTTHPYELEKDLVVSNLDEIRDCDVILEDNHFGYLKWLKSLKPNDYPKLVYSYDHHPDNLPSLPTGYVLHIICVSKWQLSVLRERFKHTGHYFYQAYSGLIVENYPEGDINDKQDNLYLYLGRFSTVKAPHFVVELAKEFRQDKFVLLGDCLFTSESHYAREIKSEADELDNCKVIFNASWNEKIHYLNKADGLLHPGSWTEILGWDMLEGLFYGCKILAFDRGSPREIYHNEKHGLIVPFTNSERDNLELYKQAFIKFRKMKVDREANRKRVLDVFDFTKHSYPTYKKVLLNG